MLILTLALLLQAGRPALPTLSPVDAGDARCMVILGFIGSRDPSKAAAAQGGVLYFAGKLRGRRPGTNIAPLVAAAADQATRSKVNAAADGARCNAELVTVGQQLRDIAPAAARLNGGRPAPAPAPVRPATPRKP